MSVAAKVAKAVHKDMFTENMATFQNRYFRTIPNEGTSGSFRRAMVFCQSLSEDDRNIVMDIIGHVCVDSVSTVFGLIQGISFVEDLDGEFELLYDGVRIEDGIQDEFLVAEEDRRSKVSS